MRLVSSTRFRWALLLIYWMFLTALLLTPQPWGYLVPFESRIPQLVQQSLADYIQHLFAFALLSALAWAACASFGRRRSIVLLISLFCYAIGTEVLQAIIPERLFQWRDILFNVAGLGIGWTLPVILTRTHGGSSQT